MKRIATRIPRVGIFFGSVIAVAAIVHSTTSFALGTEEQRAACTPDVFRLCASQIPNIDAIVNCLKTNKKNLSAGCQAAFVARPGMVLSPLSDRPAVTGPDLAAVVDQIVAIDLTR